MGHDTTLIWMIGGYSRSQAEEGGLIFHFSFMYFCGPTYAALKTH